MSPGAIAGLLAAAMAVTAMAAEPGNGTDLAPAQVKINLSPLGPGATPPAEVMPPEPYVTDDIPDGQPAHIRIGDHRLSVEIYPIARMWDYWLAPIEGVRDLIEGRQPLVRKPYAGQGSDLPNPVVYANMSYVTQAKPLETACVRAIRWLARFGQDVPYLANGDKMIYLAQGISRDGRFYVVATGEVGHAVLDRPGPKGHNGGAKGTEQARRLGLVKPRVDILAARCEKDRALTIFLAGPNRGYLWLHDDFIEVRREAR